MANTQYPKSFYQVFECEDTKDRWSYDAGKVLFEHEDLAQAHSYAWTEWKKDNTKAYTIIQPYYGDCRGGYGAWADAADAEIG